MTNKEIVINEEVEITTLSDVEHVRQRRGMYLPNMNYCAYEIVDNAVDEHMATDKNGNNYCNNIWVQITPEKILRVQDDGRGVPITPAKDDPSKSMAEVALGQLKSGGKFNAEGSMVEQGVKTGGLNGTGASAVNFCCDQFVATITKNKTQYQLAWEKGELINGLTQIGKAEEDEIPNGTLIELIPDMSIWVDDDYDVSAINKRLEQLTFLNPGLSIHTDLNYNNKQIECTHFNPEGLTAYIEKLTANKEVIVNPIHETVVKENAKFGKVDIDIAIGYDSGYQEDVYMFTNNVPNALGGQHLTGFREGLFRSISTYYEDNTKGKLVNLVQDDIKEGLVAIVSIRITNPVFDGQGKAKLNMPGIRGIVREATMEIMEDFLDKNPDAAKIIVSKAVNAQATREKVRKTREADRAARKLGGKTPNKLTSCSSKDAEECEIWLAEGDSAGGSCKKARDAKTQAILPVFGKINNVEGVSLDKVLSSVKLQDVFNALGTGVGEDFDIDKLKYHKIIIAADADDDGLHIQTLWITFFYRFLRPIVENGHLYISCPPLFKVVKDKKTYKYCYTIAEKDELLEEWGPRCKVSRFKGLGEMEASDLKESTMNKDSRVLLQVNIEDIEYDENVISACMGEDASLRRELILDDEVEMVLI